MGKSQNLNSQTTISAPCWRVVRSNDARAALREFFVGQAIDVVDWFSVHYEVKPHSLTENETYFQSPSARAGICTETTGSVEFSFSCTWQSAKFVKHDASSGHAKYGRLMHKIGSVTGFEMQPVIVIFLQYRLRPAVAHHEGAAGIRRRAAPTPASARHQHATVQSRSRQEERRIIDRANTAFYTALRSRRDFRSQRIKSPEKKMKTFVSD